MSHSYLACVFRARNARKNAVLPDHKVLQSSIIWISRKLHITSVNPLCLILILSTSFYQINLVHKVMVYLRVQKMFEKEEED